MITLSDLLPKVPANKLRELEIVTQRIIDTGHAEIIQLFGSYARGDFKIETDPQQPKKSDFDILVVTLNNEDKEKLERTFGSGVTSFKEIETVVQLIIEPIEVVNHHIQNNQYFYVDIKTEGKTLYNAGNIRFSKVFPVSSIRRREKAEKHFAHFIKEVKDFIKAAELMTEANLYRRASFDYQQAAEFLYKTVEMVYTEYQPYEHYLEVLRERVVTKFDGRMDEPFPMNNDEERFLFTHLDLAYIGSRYVEEELYSVTKEQLDYWRVEIDKLFVVTEQVCKDKIEKLRSVE